MSSHRPPITAVGLLVAAAAVLATAVVATPANAADFAVTTAADDGVGSLRQAVADANATSGPDVITLAPGLGTITLASAIEITDPVTVLGADTVVARSVDGPMVRIDLVAPGPVVLESLHFTADLGTMGSAVVAESTAGDELVLTDCRFTGIYSRGAGGAVRVESGSVTITGSTFETGWSEHPGGGVSIGTATGDSVVRYSRFDDNYVSGFGGGGAAMAVGTVAADASVHVFQSYFVHNMSGSSTWYGFRGVAIHVDDVEGEFLVDSSTFDHQDHLWPDNWEIARVSGWSIGVETISSGGTVRVVDTTFDEPFNTDPYSVSGFPNFEFFVVSVGTVNTGATFSLEHSTAVGGGTLVIDDNQGSSLVRSTIAEGMTANDAIVALAGAPIPVEWSVVSTPVNAAYTVNGAGNQWNVPDMMLAPLGDNGGPTPTMMIGPTGPAVGTGMPVALATEPILEQRGAGYLRRLGPADIGAVELPGELPTLPDPTPSPTPTPTPTPSPSFDPPTLPYADPPAPAGLARTGAPAPTPWVVTFLVVTIVGFGFVLAAQRRRAASSSDDVTGKRHTKSSQR